MGRSSRSEGYVLRGGRAGRISSVTLVRLLRMPEKEKPSMIKPVALAVARHHRIARTPYR
jgi:hypothetical protein